MHYRKLKVFFAGVILLSLLASVIPFLGQSNNVSAASVNANSYCDDKYPPLTNPGLTIDPSLAQEVACEQGFTGATNNQTEANSCKGVAAADASACQDGFNGGTAATVAPTGPEANPSPGAVFLCSKEPTTLDTAACELGYDNYTAGIPETNCAALGNGTSNLGSSSYCSAGWNASEEVAGYTKACANESGSAVAACEAGYEAAFANPNNPNPCKAFTVDSDIAACISGWNTGGGLTVLTPPTAATDPCDASGWSLSWLVCAAITPIKAGVSAAESGIENQLNLPVDNYFSSSCTSTNVDTASAGCGTSVNGTSVSTSSVNFKIWSNMRNLALSLLVIVTLIMVISTAIDVGPFDAYTVKKILPRIVIAVIAITFSWEIGRLLVQLSDDVGQGVSQLIYSAAGITQAAALNGIGAGFLAWLGITAAGAGVVLLVSIVTVGPAALLLLLLPLILGLAIGFFTLVLRRLIIVVCVIFAPLAFVAFILPGTSKVWKLWKDSFFGALIVFPMITAVIAIGSLMAYLTDNGNSGSSFLAPLTSLILFVAPFFLIPRLFKMSTGALGVISNAASGISKGGFAALKKNRQEQFAGRKARSKTGNLYSNRNALTRRLNTAGLGIATGAKGHYGVGYKKKGSAAWAALDLKAREGAAEAEKNPAMQQLQYDDDGILAMHLSAGSEAEGRAALKSLNWEQGRIDTAMATAKAVGINKANSMAAGGMLMRNKARSLPAGQAGIDALDHAAAILGNGNEQLTENIRGNNQYWARQSGVTSLGGGSVQDGWDRTTMGQLAQNTTVSMQAHLSEIVKGMSSKDLAVRRRSTKQMSEAIAVLPNTSAGNQTAIRSAMGQVGLDPNLMEKREVVVREQSKINQDGTVEYTDHKVMQDAPVSLDEQISRAAGQDAAGNRTITAAEIGAEARKYGGDVPLAERGQAPDPNAGQQPPPTTGTP